MLPRYIWMFFFVSVIYILYVNNYHVQIKKLLINYYSDNLDIYNDSSSEELVNNEEILFTKSALKKYTNLDDGLYLAILGQVFDVTNGAKHYGPGETYHVFTGIYIFLRN